MLFLFFAFEVMAVGSLQSSDTVVMRSYTLDHLRHTARQQVHILVRTSSLMQVLCHHLRCEYDPDLVHALDFMRDTLLLELENPVTGAERVRQIARFINFCSAWAEYIVEQLGRTHVLEDM